MSVTYRGFPTDLLVSIKHLGRSIVGDDDLYDAAQAYTDPAKGGGMLGPALLVDDSSQPYRPDGAPTPTLAPAALATPDTPEEDDDAPSPWDAYELVALRHILKANNVEFPRTLTKGGAIKRLAAAGITPPQ